MCPFVVAGLAFKYLRINDSVMLGHPLRNPSLTALRRVDILGLHKDWCANLTALARVRTECANVATLTVGVVGPRGRCGVRSVQGPDRGRTMGPGAVHTVVGRGRVHKSVLGSLKPLKITIPS